MLKLRAAAAYVSELDPARSRAIPYRIAVSYGRIGARLAIGVCLPVLEAESSVMELKAGADS